jgi:alkylation response protein AidB-like acyl-CoA dehydrogenase
MTPTFWAAADPLAAARALAPEVRAAADETEAQRHIPSALVERLRDAGLFHMTLPKDVGGLECDPVTASRVVEEIAAADGSTGWVLMLANQTTFFAGFLPSEQSRLFWGDGAINCGVARPIGRAVPRDGGGYTVSGRWPFASGSSHADWFMGECLVYAGDGTEPLKDADGNPVVKSVLMPRADVTVLDTWHTIGLRGTASNDFTVESVHVPDECVLQPGAPAHDWAGFRAMPLFVMNHGSHALGLARAALAAALEVVRTKRGWGGVPLKDTGRMQQAIAEGTAMIGAASAYLYATGEAFWQAVLAGEEPDARARARVRLAAAHAANESIRAVDLLHRSLATSAVQQSSPLDRIFRDIHTAGAHVMIGPLVYEAAGRAELGVPVDFPFF